MPKVKEPATVSIQIQAAHSLNLLDKGMKWSQAVLLGVINNSVGRNAPRGGAGSLQQGAEDIIIKR